MSTTVTEITAPARPGTLKILLREPAAAVSLAVVVLVILAALLAPWLAPHDPFETDLMAVMQPPGEGAYLLGTDGQGRDMLSRMLFGLRVTLAMGALSLGIGGVIGVAMGFAAAYYRRIDGLLMRLADIMLSFPAILFGLAIAAIFGPGVTAVVIALAVATVPLMARISRSTALVVLGQDYIEAARAQGMGDARLIWRHLMPNCASPILVFSTLRFGQVILLGSALSFLGLGAQPPIAELGAMAAQGRTFLFFAPHISVIPAIGIFVVVLAFNVLGDALRDALDPRLRI
ncbi:ABC transporter permease [Falsiroseomonas sp.]|uniref:ABC transporter permease n=1 Tax=Falsiroseomonas sp. TaxID=2870721 RepID=UPI00271CC5CD|nr:ABC transporter permease [Falsiroseomonas sp.]MDO9503483.1 ABC transporter permease [Falsiroseomonas sp.]MDP3419090.1 ABC transporter permease [Falsiroseomonas sp.]